MKLSHIILFSAALSLVSISSSFSMENVEKKSTATQKKSLPLPLVNHTFNVDGKDVKVALAYKYSKVDPTKTRFFFEGEVILIDPETSAFEFYVTYPLLPCLLGRIYDPMSKKSLVFHKYASHGMDSLQPFYEKLVVTQPEKLEVSLYGCEISKENFELLQKHYGGKTQLQEMNAVREFLRDNFKIPEDNIKRRYFRNNSIVGLQLSFEYGRVPVTAGVTKTGEIFHTSLVAEDVFGLEDVILPSIFQEYKTFSCLPVAVKDKLCDAFTSKALNPSVRTHFVGNKTTTDNCQYGELKFFLSEELDVPASSLPKMFSFQWGTTDIEFKNPFAK